MVKRKLAVIALIALMTLMTIALAACSSGGSGSTTEAPTSITEFKSVDFDGNEVTQDVFKDAEVTMINFWGTYCPPCIKEMPDLAKLEGEYDGKLQLIGVPIDVDFSKPDSEEYKDALMIMEEAGVEYKNISLDGSLTDYAKTMQYVPTSIFVDPDGNIIGEPVVGGDFDKYRETIESNISK
ncbi:MAG: TlpA family protein disulfide reductase [Mogibacterium sp.]|nr:TlpA family protein disulfide reductase [Mogibacterium sp.]